MKDPIVDEVRQIRDAYAKQFNYDLDAIYEDLKEQEKQSDLTYVSLPPKRIKVKDKAGSTQAA